MIDAWARIIVHANSRDKSGNDSPRKTRIFEMDDAPRSLLAKPRALFARSFIHSSRVLPRRIRSIILKTINGTGGFRELSTQNLDSFTLGIVTKVRESREKISSYT